MNDDLLDILRCPTSGQRLYLEEPEHQSAQIYSGWLVSDDGRHRYPIKNYIPRFVPESNYADNFGMQWNFFRRTQLDSHSGHPISADRFRRATGWRLDELCDQWVLDVGCGAGRFAEVALQAGAKVVAIDYSNAVQACYDNLGHHRNLHVIQGDVYHLPLRIGFFPFLYSLGVLQHTPDPAKAFAALPPLLSSRGKLVVDIYQKSFMRMLLPKCWLRPLTKRISKASLFRILHRSVPALFKISCLAQRIPLVGSMLKKMVPVANYTGILPLTPEQHLEWSLLDTFDWLSPQYDQPQTAATLRRWLQQADLVDIEVEKAGHLVGRGCRP